MAINRHLLHVKSNQTVTTTVDNEGVTRAKLPSPSNIEHGEIAINYHDGYETISIKNDNNEIVEFPNLNAVNILINEAMSGAQDALTFDETPTENSTNPVTSEGIKEYVDTGDSIQSLTTYQSSTPLAVGDTHDQALSKLSKIIDDNETVVARALTELEDTKADKDDLYTKDEVDSLIEETNDSLTQIIEDNELTIATALNDLDSRISNMKGSIEELNEPSESTPLAVGDTYDDAFAKLTKIIRDDEEITARALTDLNETKQDKITDLDTIRSGAALGATALQSETQLSKGTATGDGNVVTDIAVNNHQITLTMGLTALTENALKTVNSLSLVGSGNIDAEDVILGKLELVTETLPRIGEVSSWKFFRFLGTYTQVTEGMLRYEEPDFSSTAETPDDEKIYVDILTYKIYWYDGSSTILTNENDTLIKFKELGGVDLSSYADGAEYDSTEKKIYLKHGSTRLSNPIDATDFIKDGMVNSVRIDTIDDGYSDDESSDGSDWYEERYLIITFNTDAGLEDIEIPLSDIFDSRLYYTKEEIDEHELVTAAALTELYHTKQDNLTFDSEPTEDSENPVTSGGVYTALQGKQDNLTFDSTPTANSTNPVTSQGIKTYVDTSIGNLSNEIEELEEPLVSTPLAVGDTYDEAFAKLTKIIRDNELATAGALTDLHDTKQDLLTFDDEPTEDSENPVTSGGVYDALSNINTDHLTEVTYSELKTLRDDDELVPGMFYRITDYQCTTTQEDTQSADHQFDIVLLALSENKLAEEGWAMMHDNIYDVTFTDGVTLKCYIWDKGGYGNIVNCSTETGYDDIGIGEDNPVNITNEELKLAVAEFPSTDLVVSNVKIQFNYFQNSNLSAWKVWYCLDNDKSRFAWADDNVTETIQTSNGNYDRDSQNDTTYSSVQYYAWSRTYEATQTLQTVYTTSETPSASDSVYISAGGMIPAYTLTSYINNANGKGVIYRMIDEFNNDIKYDFKNIQFTRPLTDGHYDEDNGDDTWCYTLNLWRDDECVDASIVGNTLTTSDGVVIGVHDNKFGNCTNADLLNESDSLSFALGNNVVLCISYEENMGGTSQFTFYGCYSNTIGNSFYNNTLVDIIENTIGNKFHDNVINPWGGGMTNNNIGDSFFENNLNAILHGNLISNGFIGNNVDDGEFYDNIIGSGCQSNTIGSMSGNIIGYGFTNNNIGYSFSNNNVGNTVSDLHIGDGFQYSTIGNYVGSFITGTETNNTITTIGYLKYICIEDGVNNVALTSSTAPDGEDYFLQNITIARGVQGGATRKVITHTTLNDTFKTTYQSANSQVVSV